MSSKVTIVSACKTQSSNPKSKLRLHKQVLLLKFVEMKNNDPKVTHKQIAKEKGISDGTIQSYRKDISMDSLKIRI